jgi:hypothetical protein
MLLKYFKLLKKILKDGFVKEFKEKKVLEEKFMIQEWKKIY